MTAELPVKVVTGPIETVLTMSDGTRIPTFGVSTDVPAEYVDEFHHEIAVHHTALAAAPGPEGLFVPVLDEQGAPTVDESGVPVLEPFDHDRHFDCAHCAAQGA